MYAIRTRLSLWVFLGGLPSTYCPHHGGRQCCDFTLRSLGRSAYRRVDVRLIAHLVRVVLGSVALRESQERGFVKGTITVTPEEVKAILLANEAGSPRPSLPIAKNPPVISSSSAYVVRPNTSASAHRRPCVALLTCACDGDEEQGRTGHWERSLDHRVSRGTPSR
jgi:hypothetical protein